MPDLNFSRGLSSIEYKQRKRFYRGDGRLSLLRRESTRGNTTKVERG